MSRSRSWGFARFFARFAVVLLAVGGTGSAWAAPASGAGAKPAVACTWTFPTSGGSPSPSDDACIKGPWAISSGFAVHTLTVFAGATLQIGNTADEVCTEPPIVVSISAGGTVQAGGDITLFSSSTCDEGGDTTLDVAGGTLKNSGTIEADVCLGSPPRQVCSGGGRFIDGNILNTGAIDVNTLVTYSGPGTLTNRGQINVAAGQPLVFAPAASGQGVTVVNGTGGAITNNGSLTLDSGNDLNQGDGTFAGAQPLLTGGNALTYSGAGASDIKVEGTISLSGEIATGQTLELLGNGGFCQHPSAAVTAGRSFTNAGRIETGDCSSVSLTVNHGTLTNTGTISAPSVALTVQGKVTNTGEMDGNLTFEGPGTVTNEGPLNIASGQSVQITGATPGQGLTFVNGAGGTITNGGTFDLAGGNQFNEGDGTITGTPPLLTDGAALAYSGAGSSDIEVEGAIALSGNVATGQTLDLLGYGGFCQHPTAAVTAAKSFTNAGTIVGTDCGDVSVTVASGTLTNKGTIEARNADVTLDATVNNKGTIVADSSRTISISSLTNYAAATHTLTGGIYSTGSSATISVPGMDITTNAATVNIGPSGQLSDGGSNALQGLATNSGAISLSDVDFHVAGALTNSGTINIGSDADLVAPSGYTQTGAGTLLVGVGGTQAADTYGQLRTSGSAALAGALTIVADSGYAPTAGDTQAIVTAASGVTGAFTTITGTDAGTLSFVLQYDATDVSLVARATKIRLDPTSGAAGSQVTVTGSGFSPGETVAIAFVDAGNTRARTSAVADGSGAFAISETVPAGAASGAARFTATGAVDDITVSRSFTVS